MVLTNCKRCPYNNNHRTNVRCMRGIFMKDYDKILLKMINENTIEIIIKIIKDYLSQHES